MTDYTIEAEDMQLNGYSVKSSNLASDGGYIQTSGSGSASTTFSGEAGTYNLDLSMFDENDGASTIEVFVNGQPVSMVILDQDAGSSYLSGSLTQFSLAQVALEPGDVIEIRGSKEAGEFARIDKLSLTEIDPADAVDPSLVGDEVVLLSENFNGSFNAQDFKSVNGTLQTNGCEDGTYQFSPVDMDGVVNGQISLDLGIIGGGFEAWGTNNGDMLSVEIIDQNGVVHVLDVFSGQGSTLTGTQSGQSFSTGGSTTVTYQVPAGVESFTLVLQSDISAGSEKIAIDNVVVSANILLEEPPVVASIDAIDDVITVQETESAGDVDINVLDNDVIVPGSGTKVLQVEGQTANVGEWIDLADGGRVRIDEDGNLDFDADGDFDELNTGDTATLSLEYTIAEVQGSPEEYQCLFFNEFSSGTVITDQLEYAGLTISSANPNKPIMIFDTGNPTGGDWDLATSNLGKVLIISEDGDSSDADDNAGGGTFILDYDRPATVTSLTFLDTEEPGAEIRFYNEAGDLITTIQGPVTADGGQAVANFDVSGVARMEVQLQGSGAIDNLIYSLEETETVVAEDTATVTINVEGIGVANAPPEATDDLIVTDEETAVSGNIITDDTGNGADSDPDGDALSVSAVSFGAVGVATTVASANGLEGQLIVNADGSYTFTPGAGFDALPVGATETVTFSYTITDGNGETDTANVTITINGLNEGPVAENDTGVTDEETAVSGDLLANDSDANGDALTVTAVSFGAVGIAATVASANGLEGELIVNADGSYTFTPGAGFDALPVGAVETVSFTYTISDGNGGTDTADVTITINGLNEGPVAVADTATTDEATAVTGNVIDNDSDANGDALTVTATDFGTVGQATTVSTDSGNFDGSLTVNADGSYSFVPGAGLVALPVGATETVTVEYTISDGNGGTDTASLTITINGLNEGPVAENDTGVTDEETAVSGDLLANDSDANGDALTVTAVSFGAVGSAATVASANGLEGQLIVNSNGTYTFIPGGAFDALPAGAVETVSFSYTISDGNGGTDTADVTITINGLNEAPVATADEIQINESDQVGTGSLPDGSPGELFQLNVLSNDTDPNGDDLTVTSLFGADPAASVAAGSPLSLLSAGGVPVEVSISATGDVTFLTDGNFEGLGAGESDTVTLNYEISDGLGGTSTASVVITINGINDAPDASNDVAETDEITAVSGNILDNDSDPDGDALTVTTVSFGAVGVAASVQTASGFEGELIVNSDGSYTFTPGPDFIAMAPGDVETFSFSYLISDGNGGQDSASVVITINGLNTPPVAVPDTITITEDDRISVGTLPDGVPGALFELNVGANDSDPDGDPLVVTSVFGADPALGVSAGTPFAVTSAAGVPVEVTISATGQVTFLTDGKFNSLPVGQSDTVTVNYEISDGQGGTSTSSLVITIDGINEPPQGLDDAVTIAEDGSVGTGGTVTLNILDNDSDLNGDALTVFSVNGGAPDVPFTVTTANGVSVQVTVSAAGELSFDTAGQFEDLNDGESDVIDFSYVLDDGNGGQDTANVVINITGEGQPSGPQESLNIVFTVDASGTNTAAGSAAPFFAGFTGNTDIDGDGLASSILDAQLFSIQAISDQYAAAGLTDAEFSIVISGSGADLLADPISGATSFSVGQDLSSVFNAVDFSGFSGSAQIDTTVAAALDVLTDLSANDTGTTENKLIVMTDDTLNFADPFGAFFLGSIVSGLVSSFGQPLDTDVLIFDGTAGSAPILGAGLEASAGGDGIADQIDSQSDLNQFLFSIDNDLMS